MRASRLPLLGAVPALLLAAAFGCSGSDSGGDAEATGAAGSFGTAGSGTAGSGTAGSGTAGTGTAGTGTKGGASGSGTAGSGVAGTGAAGGPVGGSAGTAGNGKTCPPTNLPSLQQCSSSKKTACVACLCGACETTWTDCTNDKGCSDAVACSGSGCSLDACATLAPGDSLSKAFAVKACSDANCQALCQTGGAGAGGAGGKAGAGGSTSGSGGSSAGKAGSAGSSAGSGGSSAGKAGASGSSAGGAGAGGSGTMTCDPACKTDEVCNPASGLCGECLTKNDCKDSPYGLACLGTSSFPLTCGCAFSSDCNGHPGGPSCDGFNNVCNCSAAAQCASSTWGHDCVDVQLDNGVNTKQCGCTMDKDCPSGTMCQPLFKICL